MTEEEKDILQDRVLRGEADSSETDSHRLLMAWDEDYRLDFEIKEGLIYASAKEFIAKALKTPVDEHEENEYAERGLQAEQYRAAAYKLDTTDRRTPRTIANRPVWWALAASLVVAVASAYFLADFRTAEQFALAEMTATPPLSDRWSASVPTTRGTAFDWRRAYGEGDYLLLTENLQWASVAAEDTLLLRLDRVLAEISVYQSIAVRITYFPGDGPMATVRLDSLLSVKARLEAALLDIEEARAELPVLRYVLGLAKLHQDIGEGKDFGQHELGWLLQQFQYPDGVERATVQWYHALALYASGDCNGAYRELEKVDSRKARKLRRKMRSDCQLD